MEAILEEIHFVLILIGLCICDPFVIFRLIKGCGAGAQIVEKLISWMFMTCLAFIGTFLHSISQLFEYFI